MRDELVAYIYLYRVSKLSLNSRTLFYRRKMCECPQISHRKCDERANIHIKNVKIMIDVDFDTNINYDMCMKVMLVFIDIGLCIVHKYIYLQYAYCYLHHLCA